MEDYSKKTDKELEELQRSYRYCYNKRAKPNARKNRYGVSPLRFDDSDSTEMSFERRRVD